MPNVKIKSYYKIKVSYKQLEKRFVKKIDIANRFVTNRIVMDCRPLIPLDTGQLRDSGRSIRIDALRYFVIWSAYSESNYNYAEIQYYEVFNHIDGKYAARWFDRVLQTSPTFYTELFNKIVLTALR